MVQEFLVFQLFPPFHLQKFLIREAYFLNTYIVENFMLFLCLTVKKIAQVFLESSKWKPLLFPITKRYFVSNFIVCLM